MPKSNDQTMMSDPRIREANVMIPVYGQLPFVPVRASGCDIFTDDGRRILDLYGGHAVAALGYGHPQQLKAVTEQCNKLIFQSNVVALEIRAQAAEKLTRVAPKGLDRVFFVNEHLGQNSAGRGRQINGGGTGQNLDHAITLDDALAWFDKPQAHRDGNLTHAEIGKRQGCAAVGHEGKRGGGN